MRGVAEQDPEVDDVQGQEHYRVDPGKALLEEDHTKYRSGGTSPTISTRVRARAG